jgi:hypothetical protein
LQAALNADGVRAELSPGDVVIVHDTTSETVGQTIAANALVAYEISQPTGGLEDAFFELLSATGVAP